jgi:hypothetical protein
MSICVPICLGVVSIITSYFVRLFPCIYNGPVVLLSADSFAYLILDSHLLIFPTWLYRLLFQFFNSIDLVFFVVVLWSCTFAVESRGLFGYLPPIQNHITSIHWLSTSSLMSTFSVILISFYAVRVFAHALVKKTFVACRVSSSIFQ